MLIMHTQLYISFKSTDVGEVKLRFESCMAVICCWMNVNELKLNHDWTGILLISSKYRIWPPLQSLRIGNERPFATDSVRSLGVVLDKRMCFIAHVSAMGKLSCYYMRHLSGIRKYFTKESAAVAVHAFVASKLDYCNFLLIASPKYQ